MQHFDAVIFDMDGLLLDSETLAQSAFQATCDHFGLGDFSAVFRRLIGTNSVLGKAILQEGLTGVMDHEVFSAQWQKNYRALTEEAPIALMSGAQTFLEHTAALNIPMAVATSSPTVSAEKKLTNAGVLSFFRFIVGGDQVTQSKPAPDIYLNAASQLTVAPDNCLALEDSANGVRAAVAAGMTVVQIPDLIQPDDALLALGHTVLGSLHEVAQHEFTVL